MSTRTKILAYLGQLRAREWAIATKLCLDLNLRFTTAKNILADLELQHIVAKKIDATNRPVVALFCIPEGTMLRAWDENIGWIEHPFIPPEWDETYGKHPRHL